MRPSPRVTTPVWWLVIATSACCYPLQRQLQVAVEVRVGTLYSYGYTALPPS